MHSNRTYLNYKYLKIVITATTLILLLTLPPLTHTTATTEPQIEWEKTFGGAGDDWGYSVQQTRDGGYIIVGTTWSYGAGGSDVYLIKVDANGNMQWSRTYGGQGDDWGYSVQQTRDGGYIIVGTTRSYGAGGSDVYLIKVDANGNMQWSRTYGGQGDDWGYSVQQTRDGGYIIVGTTRSYGAGGSDVYLIKVDANGNMQWSRTYGGQNSDWGYSVQQTSDGGYIIVGETWSYGAGESDVYLIKVDANGNMQWSRTYGGVIHDVGFSVQQTSDGGYIIVGATWSYGLIDVYLIKVDANGNMQWNKTFGGAGRDWGFSVQQTSDGGYIIVGYTNSYGAGESDVYLIKVDANGNMQWNKTFGGAGRDWGSSVQQTSDGGYIIVGYTNSYGAGRADVYLIKLGLGTIPTTLTTVTVTTTVTQPTTTTYTTTTTATRVTTTTDTKTTTVTETQTTTQTQTTTATTTVTQPVTTSYTITKTETVHITSPLTTTITSPYTTTITQTIPATITTTLHKTETQTLTTTATTPTIITVKEVITVKEATYIPTATTTIVRPLFSEVTEALGISIAMLMVATLIGLWLRRR